MIWFLPHERVWRRFLHWSSSWRFGPQAPPAFGLSHPEQCGPSPDHPPLHQPPPSFPPPPPAQGCAGPDSEKPSQLLPHQLSTPSGKKERENDGRRRKKSTFDALLAIHQLYSACDILSGLVHTRMKLLVQKKREKREITHRAPLCQRYGYCLQRSPLESLCSGLLVFLLV